MAEPAFKLICVLPELTFIIHEQFADAKHFDSLPYIKKPSNK